jgi:molybdate transport system regulatory protein
MSKPQTRVRVDFSSECSIGPGKIALLEGIDRSGSLSAAARQLGMSYRRAWLLLHNTNEAFHEPVAEMAVGGRDGGGAQLTDFGRQLVAEFRAFEEEVDRLAVQRFAPLRVTSRVAAGQGLPRPLREPRPVTRSPSKRSSARGR